MVHIRFPSQTGFEDASDYELTTVVEDNLSSSSAVSSLASSQPTFPSKADTGQDMFTQLKLQESYQQRVNPVALKSLDDNTGNIGHNTRTLSSVGQQQQDPANNLSQPQQEQNEVLGDFPLPPILPKEVDLAGSSGELVQTPRLFQLEIFHKAKSRNVIAVLETGSGKTLISIMLLNYIHSIEICEFRDKNSHEVEKMDDSPLKSYYAIAIKKRISIFLVPTVPLVSQQASYLSSISSLRVGQVLGGESMAMNIQKWQSLFREFDVLVMTPLILLHALDRGYFGLKHLNLLVFDECHHARESHPYSIIMKIHYSACDEDKRPKIFGMTASPIAAKEDAAVSIAKLETILACTAISTSSSSSLSDFVSSPNERLVTYSPGGFFLPPPLYFRLVSEYPTLASCMETEIAESISFCDSLGPWAAERALELAVEDFLRAIEKRIRRLKALEEIAVSPSLVNFDEALPDSSIMASVSIAEEDPIEVSETMNHIPKSVSWDRSFPSLDEEAREHISRLVTSDDRSRKVEVAGFVFRPPKLNYQVLSDMTLEQCESLLDECGKLTANSPYWRESAPFPSAAQIGSKIQTLVNLLLEFQNPESKDSFCGIVFCKQRTVARVLEILLQNHEDLSYFKTGCLIGHGARSKSCSSSTSTSGPSMSVAEQKAIVQRFKQGDLNLLVATSVAEEGLDICPCNCIIRFDVSDLNLVSYLQSRGRARHQSSHFIFLADKSDPSTAVLIEYLKNSEQNMLATIRSREHEASSSGANSGEHDMPLKDVSRYSGFDIDPSSIYRIPMSGAFATVFNAPHLLNSFCSALPRDGFFEPKPEYLIAESDGGFVALLLMPRCFRNGKDHGAIQSDRTWKQKAGAKRDVAFKMIKILHEEGELDDHLRPSWLSFRSNHTSASKSKADKIKFNIESKKSYSDEHAPTVLEKKLVRSHNVDLPSPFQGSFESAMSLYLNLIQIELAEQPGVSRIVAVGFFSFQKPSDCVGHFPFHLNNHLCKISVITLKDSFFPSRSSISLFRKFHFEFFSAILRSNVEESCPWATLCVPLVCDVDGNVLFDSSMRPMEMIDWEALDFCCNINRHDKSFLSDLVAEAENIQDYVLFDPYRYKRNYLLSEVLLNTTPMTKMEIGSAGTFDCISEFYKGRLGCEEDIDADQVLIRAKPLGYPYHSTKPPVKFQEVLLIPQFCTVCPIKKNHLLAALPFPIVLRQITHRMLMQDILDGVPFPQSPSRLDLSLDLLSEAFTAPSASLATNYERLETLGDSFLKIQLTLHLFVQHPTRHEGFLTNARMQLENNNFLCQTANQLKIESLILSDPFSRQLYLPPSFDSQRQQLISDKTVADVVEAVIGASLIDGGVNNASFSVAFFLGSEFFTWDAYHDVWMTQTTVPVEPIADDVGMKQACSSVADRVGYTFKNENLLVQALTHSSAAIGGASYERLEFLGDAILGFAVTHKIFVFKNLNPGALTDLRRELVSNQFLGCVSCALGLPQLLNHTSDTLSKAIYRWNAQFTANMNSSKQIMENALKEDGDSVIDEKVLLFWNRMEASPKVMGDVFEAILGAAFVDSGFQINAVESILDKAVFSPWWPRFKSLMVNEGLQTKHPMRALADLIHTFKCRQFTSESEKKTNGLNECRFLIHGSVIASAECESKKSARKNAAFKAVEFLEKRMANIGDLCECGKEIVACENDADDEDDEISGKIAGRENGSAKRKWIG